MQQGPNRWLWGLNTMGVGICMLSVSSWGLDTNYDGECQERFSAYIETNRVSLLATGIIFAAVPWSGLPRDYVRNTLGVYQFLYLLTWSLVDWYVASCDDRFLYHPEKKITTAVIITNHTLAFTIPALATVGAACWGAVYFAQTFWRDFCTPEDKDIPPAYTESVV